MAASAALKTLWAVRLLCIRFFATAGFPPTAMCESETTANKNKLTAFYY